MPECDTIFRTARTLDRALAGRVVTRFDTHLVGVDIVDRRQAIAGRVVERAFARGKHLLIQFSGALLLRSHMRMHGSWHIYKPGERWRAPARDARVVITTDEWLAVAFNVTDAEWVSADELERHPRIAALGPDLLSAQIDVVATRDRIRASGAKHIAAAILLQQAVAGLGNVYKSELLFLEGLYPFTPVSDVPDATLDRLLVRARTLLSLNVTENAIAMMPARGRMTTGRLNGHELSWVYGRAGRACFKCGSTIRTETETGGRRTYWCPSCQAKSPVAPSNSTDDE